MIDQKYQLKSSFIFPINYYYYYYYYYFPYNQNTKATML